MIDRLIPIAIPFGWIITFYGLFQLNRDMLQITPDSPRNVKLKSILPTMLSATLFGLAIEVLARIVDLWRVFERCTGPSVEIDKTTKTLDCRYQNYWL